MSASLELEYMYFCLNMMSQGGINGINVCYETLLSQTSHNSEISFSVYINNTEHPITYCTFVSIYLASIIGYTKYYYISFKPL